MKTSFSLKSEINGLLISTVKIGKVYETMVLDQLGNELKVMTTSYKVEARHNHLNCVATYAVKKNCLHVVH